MKKSDTKSNEVRPGISQLAEPSLLNLLEMAGFAINEQLSDNSDWLIFKGIRSRDQLPVIIKASPMADSLVYQDHILQHELKIHKFLSSTKAVVKAYALETLPSGKAVLIMEDFVGLPLNVLMRKSSIELRDFLQISIQICDALAEIHRHQVIHKVIRPRNILIDEVVGEVKFINLGLASVIPTEQSSPLNVALFEDNLMYISPEQTGRMNRTVDYRADLYSLGVCLYEFLTGSLPFSGRDALEWVHFHIAKLPSPPSKVRIGIPETVSKILLKLLSKMAEDRYQSAVGLRFDLNKCLIELEESNTVSSFKLGLQDVPDRFQIPQKLYGRDDQIKALLLGFERVLSTGDSEIMLVTGYSGIGKTSVVLELQKPIVKERGFFISGKFDQYKRGIPYFTLIQAFRELSQQILAESDDKLSYWRERLHLALGVNGKVVTEIIPELELILGEQPPVTALSATENQNRFNFVFKNFMQVFAEKGHPLVLFLDDMQWADGATLNLLESLLSPETGVKSLNIILAYRDNEVNASHPFSLSLEKLQTLKAKIQSIALEPLGLNCITDLVCDAFYTSQTDSHELAQLILRKTEGNPFFVNEFLKLLYQDGALSFDPLKRRWIWSRDRIEALGITENVIDLMLGRMRRLNESTQNLLALASCVGNTFRLDILSLVSETSDEVTLQNLHPSLVEGLVIPLSDKSSYRFQHDRIQQAAYTLIEQNKRESLHVTVGRLLLEGATKSNHIEENVFEIVNQFNQGIELIQSQDEHAIIARLNALAGKRAKSSTAFVPALEYLNNATNLVTSNDWIDNYDWTFQTFLERTECEYLTGYFDRAEESFLHILSQSHSVLDQAKVYQLWLRLRQISGKFREGVELGIKALSLLGVILPEETNAITESIQHEKKVITILQGGRKVSELIDAPVMTDPKAKAIIKILTGMGPCAYLGRPEIFPLINLKMVALSLEYGNTTESSFGYSMYAMTLLTLDGDLGSAYEFSKMCIQLNEKLHDPSFKGVILHIHGNHINFWKNSYASSIPWIDRALQACVEAGDFVHSNYAAFMSQGLLFESGMPLTDLFQSSHKALSFARESRNDVVFLTIRIEQQLIASLQGSTQKEGSFNDDFFNESDTLSKLTNDGFAVGLSVYWISKITAHVIFEQWEDAVQASEDGKDWINATSTLAFEVSAAFYISLALFARYSHVDSDEQKKYLATINEFRQKFQKWAVDCPENFSAQRTLLEAEFFRLQGNSLESRLAYDRAAKLASQAGKIQEEALAKERASHLYHHEGFSEIAALYLCQAKKVYQRWGASGKVKQLDQTYSELLSIHDNFSHETDAIKDTSNFDLFAAVKASQAISSEIRFPKLMEALMRGVIEHAGAEKGFFLRFKESSFVVEAKTSVKRPSEAIELEPIIALPHDFPISIFNYVKRTGEKVILKDASERLEFLTDPYLIKTKPKSVLCFPVLKQGQVSGLIYLENNLITGAFTNDRTSLLELLAAQTSISIENERLFQESQAALELRLNLEKEKHINQQAEAAREELHALFMQAPAAICLLSGPDHVYTLMNDKFFVFFGGDPNFIGKSVREAAPELVAQGFVDILDQVYKTGEPFIGTDVPCLLTQIDGTVKQLYFDFVFQPRFDPMGNLNGIMALGSDVSEKFESRAKLQKALKARDEFLSIASHELKTPVTSLKIQLQMARRGVKPEENLSPSPAKLAKVFDISTKQIERLIALIDDLLDVSRIEAGKLSLNLEVVNISNLINEVVDRVGEQFLSAKCPIDVKAGDSLTIFGDQFRIEQVVVNLLTNALKYGKGKPVHVSVKPLAEGIRISVQDFGLGIAQDKHAMVFERFERAISHNNISGLGLGLYITKQIVVAHGGRIYLESELGKGSTFVVDLPKTPPTSG